jgi:hypothetical protein
LISRLFRSPSGAFSSAWSRALEKNVNGPPRKLLFGRLAVDSKNFLGKFFSRHQGGHPAVFSGGMGVSFRKKIGGRGWGVGEYCRLTSLPKSALG